MVVTTEHTDGLVFVGDVNSTLASAVVAAKFDAPVVHIEARLRSVSTRFWTSNMEHRDTPEPLSRMPIPTNAVGQHEKQHSSPFVYVVVKCFSEKPLLASILQLRASKTVG